MVKFGSGIRGFSWYSLPLATRSWAQRDHEHACERFSNNRLSCVVTSSKAKTGHGIRKP